MAGQTSDEISDLELEAIYHFTIQLGKDAGQLLMQGLEARRSGTDPESSASEEKMNAVDIVTKTDTGMHLSLAFSNLHHRSAQGSH